MRPSFLLDNDMLNDIFAAAALLLVFEGIMPFTSPAKWRRMILLVSSQSDTFLRVFGFISMLAGVVLLYIVRANQF